MYFLLVLIAREQLEMNMYVAHASSPELNCNIWFMYDKAREILNSCISKFVQDGWLSLRSDCGQILLQLSLATKDTVTMVQASLLLLHPEVALPSERKVQLEQAIVALVHGKHSMGLQPMVAPLTIQVDQHHRLLRFSCFWEKTSLIVEECGLLCLRVTSTCSVAPLIASSLFVDMNPSNLSFSVSHVEGAGGVRIVEFKDGTGTAQADLSLNTQGSGSLLQFSLQLHSVGVVHPNSFIFTIGSGASSLQVVVPSVVNL
jgi:hypothetical protein